MMIIGVLTFMVATLVDPPTSFPAVVHGVRAAGQDGLHRCALPVPEGDHSAGGAVRGVRVDSSRGLAVQDHQAEHRRQARVTECTGFHLNGGVLFLKIIPNYFGRCSPFSAFFQIRQRFLHI